MAARAQEERPGATAAGTPRETASIVHEGDCIELLAGLEAESVDVVVTDPPYGIGFQHERWDSHDIREAAARTGQDGLTHSEAYAVWCRTWGQACLRVLKPGAHLLAFGAPRMAHRLACGLEDAGFELRDTLIWLRHRTSQITPAARRARHHAQARLRADPARKTAIR